MGAALLYAPTSSSDRLENLGYLTLPDGELKNGARLLSPGFMDDGALARFDGTDDFIDSGWATRTNQFRNPSFELGTTEFWNASFPSWAVGLFNPSASPFAESDGKFVGLVQAQKDATATLRTATIATSAPAGSVKPGTTNTYSILANIVNNASKGVQVYVNWYDAASTYISTGTPGPLTTGAGMVTLSTPALVAPAEASFAQLVIQFQSDVSGDTVDIRVDNALGEEGSAVGSYFPTADQLESGESGWTGAAHKSPAQIGPFANGTRRTLVGLSETLAPTTGETLVASSATSSVHPYLRIDSSNQVSFDMDASGGSSVTWPEAWPSGMNFWALVIDEVDSTAELFVNGQSEGVKALTDQFPSILSNLKLGARGATGDPLEGSMLPFAVFEKALIGPQVEELWRVISGTFPRVAVAREYPPDQIAWRVADPKTGATIARWAEDESKVENVITGITKSGEMPGGHKEAGGSLARDPRVDWPDLATYLDHFLELPGGETVWEGRQNQKPESDGERMAVEPKAVGHQAALEDRNGLIGPGFIDPNLGKWGDPSTQREANARGEGFDYSIDKRNGASPTDPTDLQAGIIFRLGACAAERIEIGEAWYDGGGVDIGAVLFDFKEMSGFGEDTDFFDAMRLSRDAVFTGGAIDSTDFNQKTALNQTLTAPGSGYKFAVATCSYAGAFLGDGRNTRGFLSPCVVGNHGLALQGEWPKVGFTAKQMLEYAIPLYTYLRVEDEAIEDGGYVIPQAWFSEPGNMAAVVKELTKYELLDWFVMEEKLFQVRFPGTYGRALQAYAGPSEFKEAGEDGSRLWAEIMVRYQDVDGSTRTVGPPGSGANVEAEALKITDPDHPAVKAEIPREDLLDLRGISTPERALEAGERWLQDANELSHAGEATLRGYVMDDKAVFRPVSQIQPGDRIRFPDAGSNGTGYRKIVVASYDHDTRTCNVNLDAPSEAIQALLERFQADLTPLALA